LDISTLITNNHPNETKLKIWTGNWYTCMYCSWYWSFSKKQAGWHSGGALAGAPTICSFMDITKCTVL